MQFRKDIIPLSEDFPFNLFRTSGGSAENGLHFHDCLEIDFVVGGEGVNRIEETEYAMSPGDIYVINHLEHHMAFETHALEMIVLVFDASFVAEPHEWSQEGLMAFYHRSLRFQNRIAPSDPEYAELKTIISRIDDEWRSRDAGYRLMTKALLMQLLALLFRRYARDEALGDEQRRFRRAYASIRSAVHHLHVHYRETIRLEELAAVAAMNRSHFSTVFHQVMNRTVTQYIEQLRIEHACRLLDATHLPVQEIALESGWQNLSWFNRSFRRNTGFTPLGWRNRKPSAPDVQR